VPVRRAQSIDNADFLWVDRITVSHVIEPDFLRTTREAYDSVAVVYAKQFSDTLRDRPLERTLLSAFAEIVRAFGDGPVADLGCGPGHITAHLHGLGLSAFGVDLSPMMIGLAREAHPHLRFEVGSMAALDIADETLSGMLSRASVIHTPPQLLPEVFAEFHRVLAPGGHLLLGVSGSDGPSHPAQFYDHKVSAAYRWSPDHLAGILGETVLVEVARLIREPEPTDRRQFQEVHLLARKA
jgi:SAM-dependent methyltransferase